MGTIVEIIDAVRNLTVAEREDLFGKLRELGLEPPGEFRPDPARYGSDEFTRSLTEHFHHAKRRALEAE
jgi:hypothetical protein